MQTISMDEILQLYRKCGINEPNLNKYRTTINTGSLNNKLNTNYNFLSQTFVGNNKNSLSSNNY